MPWKLPDDPKALVALATDYPYAAPDESYLFTQCGVEPLPQDGALFAGRHAVLAHGSNRSPEQLRRKFGDGASIPVTYGWLVGFDVVYAAHVARYGAVTSTLAAVPGCRVRVAVTWLTHDQLSFMHETERMNYSYGRLPADVFQQEAGPAHASLTAYIGNRGPLAWQGGHLGLAALKAEGRPHPALNQDQLQRHLGALHHPGEDLAALLLARIEDKERRLAFEEKLPRHPPQALPGFSLIEKL